MPSDLELLNEAACLLESRKRLVFCTVVEKKGHGPRDVGAKMIVMENGKTFGTIGGGNLERSLVDECLKALKEGKSERVTFNLSKEPKDGAVGTGMICGGELSLLADVMEPSPRLIIVGAGHVALPLAKLASLAGFKIVIVDDERRLVSKGAFPMAEQLIAGEYSQVLDGFNLGSGDFAVVAHGEPEHDYTAVKKLLEKKPEYIGLLGSSKKAEVITQRLKAAGFTDTQLKMLHTPAGLEIGAETPEEIGVSILAQIIQFKRQRKA
ncbi:MAG TPA: XdhC family protein [Candidatus Bathyarchaeia archaeon]|nr:XdhC family protein [Candidatus Bathyarchaeia archaeon]